MKISDRDAELIILVFGMSKEHWDSPSSSIMLERMGFTTADVQDLLSRLLDFRIRIRGRETHKTHKGDRNV